MKVIKPGKVVVMLQGRHAGKKAVVVQSNDGVSKNRKYAHAVVVGVDQPPKRVCKRMSAKVVAHRSRVKPFVRVVNHNHVMPTRYNMEVVTDLKGKISLADAEQRKESKKAVRAVFEDRYKNGRNTWFFQ
eukprot:PhM_4_TR4198/c0_g1_i1/m.82608/K02901/RP-L27e, RPL27; large subunit ribosomal protein L27e